MKWFLSVACLGVCLAVVASRFCSDEGDCREGECCVAWSTFDLVNKGHCMKLSRRGRECNRPEAKVDFYGGKYVHDCPCAEDLVCETTPSFWDKDQLRCRVIPTTVNPDTTTEEITTVPEETTVQEILVTEEIAEGPGGEKPRDDDCEDWEYPC